MQVLQSTREVKRIKIELDKNKGVKQESLEKVLEKFGENISELEFSLHLENYEVGDRKCAKMVIGEDTIKTEVVKSLKGLKKLHICSADEHLISIFTKLPPNTLEDLKIFYNNSSLAIIKQLLKNQQNIKKLEIKPQFQKIINFPIDQEENVSPETEQEMFKFAMSLTQLTQLNLNQIAVDDEMILELNSRLVNLESLELILDCDGIKSSKAFSNIKKISFHRNTPEITIQDFSNFNNSKIKSLKIEVYPKLEPETLQKILKSFKNLKTLNIHQSLGQNNEIFSFMSNFDKIESFYLTSSLSKMDENFGWLMQTTKVNKHMKELIIKPNFPNWPSSLKIIKKLVTTFPNLEKMFIRPETIDDEANPLMTIRILRVILKSLKNLTHLILQNGGEGLINDDLELLMDHGHKLKFIDIGEFECENKDEIKKMFETKFGIIQFGVNRGILMTVGHKELRYREKLISILSHSLI